MNEMRAAQYDSYGPSEVLCIGLWASAAVAQKARRLA